MSTVNKNGGKNENIVSLSNDLEILKMECCFRNVDNVQCCDEIFRLTDIARDLAVSVLSEYCTIPTVITLNLFVCSVHLEYVQNKLNQDVSENFVLFQKSILVIQLGSSHKVTDI